MTVMILRLKKKPFLCFKKIIIKWLIDIWKFFVNKRALSSSSLLIKSAASPFCETFEFLRHLLKTVTPRPFQRK